MNETILVGLVLILAFSFVEYLSDGIQEVEDIQILLSF